MATSTRAVTRQTLGAWLIKARGGRSSTDELVRRDLSGVTSRCVRRTYRTDLVEPGQPVLLWISGASESHPAGIYAEGRTTGRATADPADDDDPDPPGRRSQLLLPVRLRALTAPVPRGELIAHPALSRIEVLRMPAGSNPSFLTADELAVLRADWPQVTVQ